MRKLIKGLKAEGKTILLASHNQGDIDELCDTVCEMDAGVMTMIREGGEPPQAISHHTKAGAQAKEPGTNG